MIDTVKEISTEEFKKAIDNPAKKIIDVRPIDAYNGWQLNNEPRGGHISGARSLPFKWTDYIDWIEMVRLKQILPEHDIIVYGYNKDETDIVAERFIASGYGKVSVYYHFIDEWTADSSLPMQKLERYKQLVYAGWLTSLISGGRPPYYVNDKFRIVHAH
ncbi:MAG: rhodanese-like domain-containing protein [Bacteroidales bacterium]